MMQEMEDIFDFFTECGRMFQPHPMFSPIIFRDVTSQLDKF